jgi:hypothetical protein
VSHFAELDDNNKVIRVLVGDNNAPNEGYDWFVETLGGRWVQTSYNGSFRKQFAGIGYTYDSNADVFIAPQPFPSWTLNESNDWEPPVPYPNDGFTYSWNESTLAWDLEDFSELEA